MNADQVCGTCVFGADAFDRFGNLDGQYVICQVKEAENRQRKPDRFQTTSGVSRMYYLREACHHWRADPSKVPGEAPLPMHHNAHAYESAPSGAVDPLYDTLYGGPRVEPVDVETDWRPPAVSPAAAYGGASYTSQTAGPHVASAASEAEIKRLKTQLMQSEQMVISLQTQNTYLAEEVSRLKEEHDKNIKKLEQLKHFDVALFAEVNYFSLLGVKENASPEQIKEAYRTRMKILHPDRFINISQRLNAAYETLMDVEKRRKYLQQIRQSGGRPNV